MMMMALQRNLSFTSAGRVPPCSSGIPPQSPPPSTEPSMLLRTLAHLGGVEGEENSVKHVSVHLCHQSILGSLEWREDFVVDNDCDDHQGGVGPGVGLLLLHLIL